MRSLSWVFLIAVFIPDLHGQVFEVNGGSSSLYQAQGGTISARGSSYDASLGAGIVAGRFVGGANLTKMVGKSTYILGDDYIRFLLPTDIFDTSHYLIALGAGVKTTVHNTDIFALAGATSNDFSSPLFEGVRAESPAGIVFVKKQILPQLQLSSNMVFSNQTTAIQSLDWHPAEHLKIAASGGVGANQPYGAASLDYLSTKVDVMAAYIEAGSQFHRVAVDTPLLSEPDRENVMVTVKPSKFFSFGGGRQNFLTPVGNSTANVRSSVDQASGNLQVAGAALTASFFHSSYLGVSNDATAYTASRAFLSRIHTTTSYLESRPSNAAKVTSLISNITESLTPRLDATELISWSKGQTTVSFGGAFLSNIASVSAEYQTYYIPERNAQPFEQALILDVQLHLIRGLTLHGATFVAPDGSLRYTADSQTIMTRQGSGAADNGGSLLDRAAIGSQVLRGTVADAAGHPIAGAALMFDQLLVYTDDDGAFLVRERKPHTHQLKVLVDQFLGGGVYRVVTAPATVKSDDESSAPETAIVVERLETAVR
ncbi:MAG: hypothetical protein WBE72_09640 [Terracidiphilus sp.]